MKDITKSMPSPKKLMERHARTIHSPGLKAIRDWRLPGNVTDVDEKRVREKILEQRKAFSEFFHDTMDLASRKN